MRATSVVTVLLPLVPVMPTTGLAPLRANSSMSPITGTPQARAATKNGSDCGNPGEATTQSAPVSSADVQRTQRQRARREQCVRSSSRPGGAARVSVTLTCQPLRSR